MAGRLVAAAALFVHAALPLHVLHGEHEFVESAPTGPRDLTGWTSRSISRGIFAAIAYGAAALTARSRYPYRLSVVSPQAQLPNDLLPGISLPNSLCLTVPSSLALEHYAHIFHFRT